MRILLQRVSQASVSVRGEEVAAIGPGLLAFVGFGPGDGPDLPRTKTWQGLLKKIVELRIFPDSEGRLNNSLADVEGKVGELLLVSQFTLYADCRKGRRPSFHLAAAPDLARTLFDRFVEDMERLWPGKTGVGRFGEEMGVALRNWGPVTILLDSAMFDQNGVRT
jgi:D-tyrosyl-tRNA(Tyr) deacylase